jgi:hypothetical protein
LNWWRVNVLRLYVVGSAQILEEKRTWKKRRKKKRKKKKEKEVKIS